MDIEYREPSRWVGCFGLLANFSGGSCASVPCDWSSRQFVSSCHRIYSVYLNIGSCSRVVHHPSGCPPGRASAGLLEYNDHTDVIRALSSGRSTRLSPLVCSTGRHCYRVHLARVPTRVHPGPDSTGGSIFGYIELLVGVDPSYRGWHGSDVSMVVSPSRVAFLVRGSPFRRHSRSSPRLSVYRYVETRYWTGPPTSIGSIRPSSSSRSR